MGGNRLVVAISVIALILGGGFLLFDQRTKTKAPIKVGILHSLTGTMAISEKSVVDASLMAIAEINESGGLLGRRIEPVVVDGKSDWPTFASEAERLITQEQVKIIFGCWTSACRKTVRPVFERLNHLLVYPIQYEGLEQSPNIIYTGAAPNQQILPAVRWSFKNLGKKVFLVGSDYVFPRTANAIIKDAVAALDGEVVGEEYVLLGSHKVDEMVAKIVEAKPDVILNTINGDSNISFFKALRKAGITPKQIPTLSFSIAEEELRTMDIASMAGDFASWNYFQSIDTPENRAFVRRFKDRYGENRVTDDPIEAGYFGVYLWSQAVVTAGSADTKLVRQAIKNEIFQAPEGTVFLNADTNHTWKSARIGQIRPNGQFKIIWNSKKPVRPIPYPYSRSRTDWDRFLNSLQQGWGGLWANPGH
ncbi:MAG: urea ABC transporter substrate-binding protein [Magnetococcales bacterium]|nr:urea ABC transporter substrate-binding protein [Magnetococcales bacterium]